MSVASWADRPEHPPLVLGQGSYVGDIRRDGALALAVVRSSDAHGVVRNVDVTRARAMSGVHAVLTATDLDAVPHLPLRTDRHPAYLPFTEPVLAKDEVRYVGQPLAVVVADSPRLAEDAAELVDVDIESLAVADDVASTVSASDGDVERVFADADVVVRTELSVGRDTGMPMETRGLVAEWEGDGRLHVWGATKVVPFTRRALAGFFDMEPESVVCHRVDVGGMFGPRGELYPEDFLVPWAARVVGRPVTWIEDRREHFLAINHSREQRYVLEVAATSDGRLRAMRAEIWVDLGAYVRPIAWRVPEGTVEHLPGPYQWEALSIRCHAVRTNKTPAGTMRGPTSYETTFARERILDLLAQRVGIDPVEVRRRNLLTPDSMPHRQPLGEELHPVVYDSGDYPKVFEGLLDSVDLPRIRAAIARRRSAGELVGLGVACFLGHSGLGPEEKVRLDVDAHGHVVVTTSASEVGQGVTSMVSRVLREELGEVTYEVRTGDVDGGGTGSFASRSTMQLGGALVDACRQLHSPEGPVTVWGTHRMDEPTYGFGAHLVVTSIDAETAELRIERLAVAFDCGTAIDPVSARTQLEGAAIQGLSGAAYSELPYDEEGQPLVTTFMNYLMPTVTESPQVETFLYELPGTTGNTLAAKGVGEAGIIGVGAAVAGAVSDALGDAHAIRDLPVKPDAIASHLPRWPAPQRAPKRRRWLAPALVAAGAAAGAAVVVAVRWARRRRGR